MHFKNKFKNQNNFQKVSFILYLNFFQCYIFILAYLFKLMFYF